MDFASLVLRAAMAAFGQPITVTPTKSMPTAAAYSAVGVYSLKPVQIPIEGTDLFQQSHQHELGIKVPDFPALPAQGDGITMAQGSFEVFNVLQDGQGGANLVLRKL